MKDKAESVEQLDGFPDGGCLFYSMLFSVALLLVFSFISLFHVPVHEARRHETTDVNRTIGILEYRACCIQFFGTYYCLFCKDAYCVYEKINDKEPNCRCDNHCATNEREDKTDIFIFREVDNTGIEAKKYFCNTCCDCKYKSLEDIVFKKITYHNDKYTVIYREHDNKEKQ